MAADPLGITASIAGILKALASSSVLINGIRNAPQEAIHVAAQLRAVQAILTSLTTTFDTVQRPPAFLEVWGWSLRLVLDNICVTLLEMNERLRGDAILHGAARLSLWRRITWPFGRSGAL